VSKALQASGVRVGHEKFKDAGTVGMFFAVEDVWYPGKHWCTEDEQKQRRSDYEFEQVWHFTRDPRKVIASLASTWFAKPTWCWQERHTGISCGLYPKKLRAMKFWVAWNELIEKNEKIDLFFRLENIDAVWPEICSRLGITGSPAVPAIDRDYGTIGRGQQAVVPVTWDEMKSIDNETHLRVRDMAARYGYEE
jgi:hypothetical protein